MPLHRYRLQKVEAMLKDCFLQCGKVFQLLDGDDGEDHKASLAKARFSQSISAGRSALAFAMQPPVRRAVKAVELLGMQVSRML